MENTIAKTQKTNSSSYNCRTMKLVLNATTKSLIDIEMLRNDVSNYSGFIRAKIFKYPLDKIKNSPSEKNPIYINLPEFLKKDAEYTDMIDYSSLSQNVYDILSSYNEIIARYKRDCNSSLIREDVGSEKVLDNDFVEKKFRELTYRMNELQGKFHAFFQFIKKKTLRPYGLNWPEFPEYIPEKTARKDDEKIVPLNKYYAKIANTNHIGIKFNLSEFNELEKLKEEQNWDVYSHLILRLICGRKKDYGKKISDIISSNNLAEQIIVISNFSRSLASKIKYSAYRYEKKMDEMKADEKIKKNKRESFVLRLFISLLKEESKLENLLNYFLASYKIGYESAPFDEKITSVTGTSFEEENDYEIAKRMSDEYNKRK